jgi:hypothetical protein|nr:MAG TPA: Minor structural protein 4 [Caudoviricetes sp.]
MGKTLGYGEITVANMTEPFTVMLTNEAQQFATDSNRKVTSAQSYYTDIIVIRGSQERTDYTIGNITSGSGITVSKTSKRVTFSVSAGSVIGADTGVIEIPITLDGQTVKKQFSWSCGKQGPQGVKGENGQAPHIHIAYANIMFLCSENSRFTLTESTLLRFGKNDKWVYKTLVAGTYTANATTFGSDPLAGTVKQVDKITDFSIGNSTNKTHMGQYADFIESNSSDPSKYTWVLTKGINGSNFSWNLLQDSSFPVGTKKWNLASGFTVDTENKYNGYNSIKIVNQSSTRLDVPPTYFADYNAGEDLYLTFWIMCPDVSKITTNNVDALIGFRQGHDYKPVASINKRITKTDFEAAGNGNWFKVSIFGNCTVETATTCTFMLQTNNSSATFYVACPMLSRGNVEVPYAPHHNDLEGKGVQQEIIYYLATSASSGVTTLTSGWSTDPTTQKLTAEKKYLWSCKRTEYSDGTTSNYTTPSIIGVYGDKGTSTKIIRTSYEYTQTNIDKFSTSGYSGVWGVSDATTDLKVGDSVLLKVKNTTKGSDCLIFANITAIPSNYSLTCTSYGVIDNGSDGQDGKNAKNLSITPSSQYFKSTDGGKTFAPNTITIKPTIQGEINFGKWQYSIDGGVSFADVVSGQKGLTISNNVLTVSKDSSLYSDAVTMITFRAVADDSSFYDTCSIAKIYDVSDIEIGGVNLIKNSNFADGVNQWAPIGITYAVETDSTYGHHIKFSSSVVGDSNHRLLADADSNFNHTKNTTYTLSFYAKASANTQVQSNIAGGANPCNYSLTTSWQRYTTTYKASAAGSLTFWAVEANKDIYLANIKLERGNKPTDYTVSPEDVQAAILSTKNSIDSVSSKVDTNTKSIQDKVSKTTYERELTLVKGDLSKANDGLNKWRYEIYPKSLFDSEDQSKSTIDIFARNLNLVPSQTVLLDDASLSTGMNYRDGYIAYALTFVKMSAKKDVTTKMFSDDGASLYVNGGLVITRPSEYTNGEEITFALAQGWNCIEVVVNEGNGTEGFRFSTTLSKLSECQMMNCYYGTPVARQSRITNQLVDVTKNLTGVTSTVQDVMTAVGNSGNITEFKNNYSKWKQNVDKIESRVGEKYVTNEKFDGLEIGGRNLLTKDDCNMSKWQNLYPAHCKITSNDYLNHVDYVPTGGEWEIIYKKISVTKGQKYILSFDYKVNKAYNYLSGQKYGVYLSTSVPTNATPANIITNGQYVIENTVTNIKRGMITFTAAVDTLYIVINGGCIDDNQTGLSFEFNKWKIEKGNKATDWTPAPEDNEINGQNLVSNLPSNWEQGTVTEGSTTGTTYANTKSSSAGSVRPKELIPVSGNITISTAYSNQSKKPIRHWIAAYDVNKNYLGNNYVSNAWNSFPRTLNMKDAKYIAIMVGYTDSSAITPSDISKICLKIERGTSATPFTLAPEDVNGKIVNIETIANQTAKKFEWIVKGGDKSSSMVLTDDFLNIVANNINLTGKVTFNSLSSDAKNEIGKVAQSKVDDLEVGGRNLLVQKNITQGYLTTDGKGSFINSGGGDQTSDWIDVSGNKYITITLYEDFTNTNNSGRYCEYDADKNCISTIDYNPRQKSSVIIELKSNTKYIRVTAIECKTRRYKIEAGNKATDWTPAPEDYLPQANLVSNWATNSTWIDGGKIYTGSITADKIATDAIKSRNYISSGGTQGSFLNLSDGGFKSPNLSWDSNGNLIAKNANLSGQITATKGTVGGWNIDNYSIYTTYDANQNIFGAGISGTKGKYVLWAGETNDAIGANRSSNVPTDASLVIYNNGGLEVRKSMVGNDKKNHLYTTILQSGQINLKMDDDYIGTITATDTISSNSTVTMRHVSMAAKNGYGWSILHTNESGSLISDMQRDPGDTKIKINSPITVFSTDITKYNAIETTGDVVVSGKIHANYGSNKIQLNPDNNGSIELYGYTPFIDFHYGNSDSDYTSRIIAQEWGLQIVGTATVTGDLYCDAHIYTCTNGHFSWAGQTDAYLGCGNYSGGNNIYYYANYHAFYVNNDSGSGMMYINTNGVTSRVGFTKTSDERIKKNFESFDDNIIDAYMNIEPVKYQLKQSSNDSYHFGFKAQHIDKVFSDYGDAYNESFDICTSRPIDPDKAKELYGVDDMTEEYGLRYDELIAPTTYMVQHIYKKLESTKGELTKVKQEKADLEVRLQAIEAKLGL